MATVVLSYCGPGQPMTSRSGRRAHPGRSRATTNCSALASTDLPSAATHANRDPERGRRPGSRAWRWLPAAGCRGQSQNPPFLGAACRGQAAGWDL